MGVEDAIKFCGYVEQITTLPLSKPAALYLWLPDKPNTSRYINADMDFRQMLSGAETHMSRERAASITKEAIALADRRLVATAMPAMISYRDRLLGGLGPAEQLEPRKRVDVWGVQALVSHALSCLFDVLRGD